MEQQRNSVTAKSVGSEGESVRDWNSKSGHPLRDWRKANHFSLETLAAELNISPSSLSRIERNKQSPLIGTAKKIIEISKGYLKPEDFFVETNQ